MARTWCCHTLSHRRSERCTGPAELQGFLYFPKHGHVSLQELVEDLLCRPRDTWKEVGLYLLLEMMRCVSLTPEECLDNNHRPYNKYLNNSVNELHLVDLDCPSGTLNSVAETTSTVFCAVWMYTVRMGRTWCCNTLSHR